MPTFTSHANVHISCISRVTCQYLHILHEEMCAIVALLRRDARCELLLILRFRKCLHHWYLPPLNRNRLQWLIHASAAICQTISSSCKPTGLSFTSIMCNTVTVCVFPAVTCPRTAPCSLRRCTSRGECASSSVCPRTPSTSASGLTRRWAQNCFHFSIQTADGRLLCASPHLVAFLLSCCSTWTKRFSPWWCRPS